MAGNAGAGAGSFAAGFARSIGDALLRNRKEEREARQREEDRQDKLRAALLPTLLENVENPADLEGFLPGQTTGKTGKKNAKAISGAVGKFMQGGLLGLRKQDETPTTGGAVTPAMGPAAAAQAPTAGNGKVVMSDLDTGAPIGEAPATGRRTLMGVPIMSEEEKIDRGMSKLETETTAKVDLARRMLPQLKAVDPTATMDDALAVVGIRTPSATARSAAAMRPQSIRGTVNGEPAFGIFDPTTKGYIYPAGSVVDGKDVGGQPIPGFQPLTSQDTMSFGVDREAIAQSIFGKRFSQLAQQEQAIVLREEKTMLQSEASARTLGGAQGKFQAPTDIPTAQAAGVPVGTSAAQVAGQTAPTMQQIERRKSVEQLKSSLTDIKDRLLVALPKQNELQGLAPGAAYAVRRRLPQYRNQIASLESAINNVVNVMARSVGEQRGTQTERDALRAEAAIAQIRDALLTGDTQESATARITESLAVLDRILGQLPAPMVPTGGAVPNAAPTVTPVQPTEPTRPQNQPAQAPAGGPRKFIKDPATGNWVMPPTQ